MPFKIVNLGGQENIQPEQKPESWGEFATEFPKRAITQAIPRGISGAVGIPAGIAKFVGENVVEPVRSKIEESLYKAIPGGENLRKNIQGLQKQKEESSFKVPYPSVENVYKGQAKVLEKLGVPKEFLESKPGFIEGTTNRALTALPYAYLLPGSFLANATRELGASAGGQAVEEFGGGPLAQLTGSLIGGWGTGKGINAVSNFLKKGGQIQNLESLADTAKTKFYDTEKELGKKITVKAPEYHRSLNSLYDEIIDNTALPTKSRNELVAKIRKYEGDVAGGKLNASKLAERTKQINGAYSSVRNPLETTYLERIQKAMFEEGERIGKEFPEWHNAWESARSIGRAQSYKVVLPELFQSAPKLLQYVTNGTMRAILGLSGIQGGLNKSAQIIGFLNESPASRQLLQKAIEYTVDRNIPALERTYRQLQKKTEEFEKENTIEAVPEGKYRIIKS